MTTTHLPQEFNSSRGSGTFQGDDKTFNVKDIVVAAIRNGYRHIDCAAAYGNEVEVGRAIRESGVPREDLFVTSKLPQTWHEPADVAEALQKTLNDLQLEYLDLYLMHFPYAYCTGPDHSTLRHSSGNGKPVINFDLSRAYPSTWHAMENLVESNRVRSIGLSNFNILKTKRILETARIRPAVNQVELHPYLPQHELLQFCQREGIHVTAHQSLGGRPSAVVNLNSDRPGPLLDSKIGKIAMDYGTSSAQILLSWAVQRGTSVVPKTGREERLVENLNTVRLREEDFLKINALADVKGSIRYLDPKNHVGFDVFNEEQDEPIAELAA